MDDKSKKKTKDDLEPFGAVIQVCPECGKIDVYKDDGHNCHVRDMDREENLWK